MVRVRQKNQVFGVLCLPVSFRYLQPTEKKWSCKVNDNRLRFHTFYTTEKMDKKLKKKEEERYKMELGGFDKLNEEAKEEFKSWYKENAAILKDDARAKNLQNRMTRLWVHHIVQHQWGLGMFFEHARDFYLSTKAAEFLPFLYDMVEKRYLDQVKVSTVAGHLFLPKHIVKGICKEYFGSISNLPKPLVAVKQRPVYKGKNKDKVRAGKVGPFVWYEIRFMYDKKNDEEGKLKPVLKKRKGEQWLISGCGKPRKVKEIHFPAYELRQRIFGLEEEKNLFSEDEDDDEEGEDGDFTAEGGYEDDREFTGEGGGDEEEEDGTDVPSQPPAKRPKTARSAKFQRCYQKPLLDSDTLGAKCSTRVVIPHLSENYGASRDPPEKQAPMCTVHSFQHNIDHCLTWARSASEELLGKTPAEVNAYLSNPGEHTKAIAQARGNLERVLECLGKEECETFQDCVTWARLRSEDYFANRVKQLTFTFHEDAATSAGAPFWSAPKRFSCPLQLSDDDSSHLHLIMAGSVLRAEAFGIPIPDWVQNPKKLVEAVNRFFVPDFEPRKYEKATSLSSALIDDVAVINELIANLEHCRESLSPGYMMKPIHFAGVKSVTLRDKGSVEDDILFQITKRMHKKVISITGEINETLLDGKLEGINPKLLQQFDFGARAVLNPSAAMFGGIVGQEVVKACSGKFHQLHKLFYFDSLESLPTEPLEDSDLRPLNTRYDAKISVFGARPQENMEDPKVFVVGSGALGCEFLKNLALMGVSCGKEGKLTVTEDDVIEKSNLSRQLLFRDCNIGQAKSTVAVSAALSINPNLHVEALQNHVGPKTEIDNVNAGHYVDQRCLYYQKPVLESGTLGAKCNTQMVIPHLSKNYGASRDPPERQSPMLCTVHSFPHYTDHCLTWAKSEFEGLLEKTPAEVNAYLSNPGENRNAGDVQARDNLERVLRFEDYSANRVEQPTSIFPEDAATSTGAPVWSAPKHFPRPLQVSDDDSSHLHFIMAGSVLRAETFGIPIPDWVQNPKKLAEAVNGAVVPDFEPRKDVKTVTDEKATSLSSASIDDVAVINELIAQLEHFQESLSPGYRMKPIQFEKDDDTNYHTEMIAALANTRPRNYAIPEVDNLNAKFTAGRIIPAIATSTALATGLVSLDLYKVLAGGHKVEDYRNTYATLALPFFSMSEPVPPKTIKHRGRSWMVWDRGIIKDGPDPSPRELLNWLSDKGLNAYSISCDSCLLYNSMFPMHKERMDKKLVDLARDVAKVEIPAYRRHIDVLLVSICFG